MKDRSSPFRARGQFLLLFLMLAGALGAGCAGKSILKVIRPLSVPLAGYRTVAVRVFSEDKANAPEVAQLRKLLIDRIAKRKLFVAFDQSTRRARRADLGLAVAVLAVKRVSQNSRALLGAFAGRASVRARVRLVELSSRRLLGEALAIGQSSAGSIFAGTTMQAVHQAARQIVTFLAGGLQTRAALPPPR